jgi:hypothetical protein
MASEVGVLDIAPEEILASGRLEPGKIFFIDTEKGRILSDREIKEEISGRRPYGKWLKSNLVELADVANIKKPKKYKEPLLKTLKAFGYTRDDMKFILKPMAEEGKEPIGSMGNDAPHAILSRKPQLLFTYFKQLFAQVTNPAIDPIREECVMSLESFIGPQRNILSETPEHCHKLHVKEPILIDEDLEKIRNIKRNSFRTKTISLLFSPSSEKNFTKAVDSICKEAEGAIKDGYSFIILSDRGVDKDNAALPSLLATGAVHHHLVRRSLRTQIGIIIESGEPREVHHFALLFGYGADCINPYLSYEALRNMVKDSEIAVDPVKALNNYRDRKSVV